MTSPTTPRYDIAGLSEPTTADLLRGCVTQSNGIDLRDPQLLRSAATQLDALSAKVKELKAERRRHDAEVRSWKIDHDQKLASTRRRATRLQQERDTLARAMEDTASELGCPSDNEAILEAIARLKQERDEAYERLKPFARDFDLNDCDSREDDDAMEVAIKDLRAARDLVRRLAGPEKEK